MTWRDGTTTQRSARAMEDANWNVLDAPDASHLTAQGDSQDFYATPTAATRVALRKGTAASPDATLGPVLKVERTMSILDTAVAGDGGEQCAAILAVNSGVAGTEVQPVGVYGAAKNASAATGSTSASADACGLYGGGRITGSGVGVGIGAFLIGRRDNDTGKANGLEVHCANYGTVAPAYNSTGFSSAQAIWINCSGNADSASAVTVSNAFGRQFEVGLAFTGQVTGALTGGVRVNSIRDDSASTTAILVKGSHSTAAMAVGAGSGKVMVGAEAGLYASALLEVIGGNADADPLVVFGSSAYAKYYSMRLRNSSGSGYLAISGGVNNGLTGTIAGDCLLAIGSTGKFLHLGGTQSVVKVGQDNTLGFNNATAIAKPTVTGSRSANAALASLLTALANYGLVTDSSSA
jgi:hypothetical protein